MREFLFWFSGLENNMLGVEDYKIPKEFMTVHYGGHMVKIWKSSGFQDLGIEGW
jgi:DNA topoisomerase VI subunit B